MPLSFGGPLRRKGVTMWTSSPELDSPRPGSIWCPPGPCAAPCPTLPLSFTHFHSDSWRFSSPTYYLLSKTLCNFDKFSGIKKPLAAFRPLPSGSTCGRCPGATTWRWLEHCARGVEKHPSSPLTADACPHQCYRARLTPPTLTVDSFPFL